MLERNPSRGDISREEKVLGISHTTDVLAEVLKQLVNGNVVKQDEIDLLVTRLMYNTHPSRLTREIAEAYGIPLENRSKCAAFVLENYTDMIFTNGGSR